MHDSAATICRLSTTSISYAIRPSITTAAEDEITQFPTTALFGSRSPSRRVVATRNCQFEDLRSGNTVTQRVSPSAHSNETREETENRPRRPYLSSPKDGPGRRFWSHADLPRHLGVRGLSICTAMGDQNECRVWADLSSLTSFGLPRKLKMNPAS